MPRLIFDIEDQVSYSSPPLNGSMRNRSGSLEDFAGNLSTFLVGRTMIFSEVALQRNKAFSAQFTKRSRNVGTLRAVQDKSKNMITQRLVGLFKSRGIGWNKFKSPECSLKALFQRDQPNSTNYSKSMQLDSKSMQLDSKNIRLDSQSTSLDTDLQDTISNGSTRFLNKWLEYQRTPGLGFLGFMQKNHKTWGQQRSAFGPKSNDDNSLHVRFDVSQHAERRVTHQIEETNEFTSESSDDEDTDYSENPPDNNFMPVNRSHDISLQRDQTDSSSTLEADESDYCNHKKNNAVPCHRLGSKLFEGAGLFSSQPILKKSLSQPLV